MKTGTLYELERDFRRSAILAALRAHDGSRTEAARTLGIARTYLLRLIHDLGLQADSPSLPHGRRAAHVGKEKVR